METVLSMAVDNDHARSGHPRQGSTPASHVWARQLNSQTNRTEKRWESLLAVQHGRFVNAKPGLSMEEPDLEQVLPSTRPSRSCRDLNHGRPSTGGYTRNLKRMNLQSGRLLGAAGGAGGPARPQDVTGGLVGLWRCRRACGHWR